MEERYNPKKKVSYFNEKILKCLTLENGVDKNTITEVFAIWNNNVHQKAFFKYFVKSTSLTNFTELLIKLLKNNFSKKKAQVILNRVILLYFEQDLINKDFLILLNNYNFKLLHDYYFTKGLKNDNHTKSFIEICKENNNLTSFVNIFRNLWIELDSEEKKYINYMTKIDFFKLFYSLNNFVHRNYFDKKKLSDIKALHYVDGASLIISNILNKKRKIDDKIYTTNSVEIEIDILKQQLVKYPPIDEMTENLIKFYHKKCRFYEIIKDITKLDYDYTVENKKVHLYPKNEECFISLKNTNIKQDLYFYFTKNNIRQEINDNFSFISPLNKETYINILNDSSKMTKIFGEEVLGMDCHNVINFFHKLAERSIRKYEIDSPATNIRNHTGWGPVNLRTIKELTEVTSDKLASKRKLTEEEMTKYMDIFSTDINNKDEKINLKTTPFLKYNDNYIWGHLFLTHKNLATLFNNNVILKNIKNPNTIIELSKKFESNVKNIFDKKNIKNISNCTTINSNILKYKDIDILAFKDNYLFIIEIKLTYDRLNYWDIYAHINGALKKGKKQLLDRIQNIHLYLTEDVKKQLDIKNDNFDIIPLIVTSSFEGGFNCGNGVLKCSIFELDAILNSILEDGYHKKNIYEEFKQSLEREELLINNIEFIIDF